MPGFLTRILFGRPPLLAECVDLDVRLCYVVVQNLGYECGNSPQTMLKAATQHWYIVPNMCSNPLIPASSFPEAYNEDVQQEYLLVGGGWLYQRVIVANTGHLSKHHSYYLQSQNRGSKDRSPELHLIADDSDEWITNTITPQYAHIISYPGVNACRRWGCCIFSVVYFEECTLFVSHQEHIKRSF